VGLENGFNHVKTCCMGPATHGTVVGVLGCVVTFGMRAGVQKRV
jgi:hypothetical protein